MGRNQLSEEWQIIDAALKLYLAEAECNRSNAGYAGEWGDRGASYMEDRVAAYRAGRMGEVPIWLAKCYAKVVSHADPEFETFQRLKKKFEGS